MKLVAALDPELARQEGVMGRNLVSDSRRKP